MSDTMIYVHRPAMADLETKAKISEKFTDLANTVWVHHMHLWCCFDIITGELIRGSVRGRE